MIRRRILALPTFFLALLLSAPLAADVVLPVVIGSNMVLQRGEAVPIWGHDEPGTAVTVTLGATNVAGVADKNGRWLVMLPAMEAGGPHEVKITGSSTVTLENVLVGEVWLCSGQSNMEWPVRASDNAEQEIEAATDVQIRHIKIPHVPADTPQENVRSEGWQVCSPQTVPNFTAVGYFFARHLRKELGVPVGLLGSNWGGTRIEPWTPPVGFRSVEALSDISDNLESFPKKNDKGQIQHQSALALYNGMIHPLVPFGLRGALWYQGESNNGEGMLYYEKKKALIAGWRAVWGKPELPFYFVQLAPFRYGGDPTRLAGIWEAQLETLTIPHTGMAVTVDIANITDIHPRNKQDVGKRLALWALAHDYGREGLVHSGPLYKSHAIEGSSVRIRFDHVGGGLVSRDGKPLSRFTIAGKDKTFVEAQAEIDGDTVVVRADGVEAPVAVRFGWHQEAEPNLSNKEGLPASPFRTDRPSAIDLTPEKQALNLLRGACFRVGDYFLSGQCSQPYYAEIKNLGVKTIVLVRMDGELDGLGFNPGFSVREMGMKYIHFPVSPDTIDDRMAKDFIKTLREAEKPLMIQGSNGNRVWGLWALFAGAQFGASVDEIEEIAKGVGIKKLVIDEFVRDYLKRNGK